MEYYHLDGRRMTSKGAAHRYLKRALRLPDYYGKNLDALDECLSELAEKPGVTIILHRPDAVLRRMGEYGERLLSVFTDNAKAGLRFYTEEK